MINSKYKIEKTALRDWGMEFTLYHTYTTNYEDQDYCGAEDKCDILFTGSLSDCNAFLELRKQGII